MLQGRQLREGRETLHFLCNNGFRVGMLEVKFFALHDRNCAGHAEVSGGAIELLEHPGSGKA